MAIDAQTTIGTVALTVTDLPRALAYYKQVIGLQVQQHTQNEAYLGAGGPHLLRLTENRRAQRTQGTTGLYHFALLVPSRLELGRVLYHLAETQLPIGGLSDHGVSEAIYLNDPDGNGIEIYRDRPQQEWQVDANGRFALITKRMDVQGVLAAATNLSEPFTHLHPDTTIGHMHLHVGNLPTAVQFYTTILGFDLVAQYGPTASFVSAGGYHHHIGLNTWAGEGAPPPPADAIGLQWYAIQLPTAAALAQVETQLIAHGIPYETQKAGLFLHDPAQNGILLTALT